jgi:hypothetical protein
MGEGHDLFMDLQPSYPMRSVGKPKMAGPETCEKCGMVMYYGKEDHKCQYSSSIAVTVKPKTYFEELEEEAGRYGGKYVGILYPKFMLSAYYYVHNDKWSFSKGGNPETFIDHHLGEWVSKLPHKDVYLQILTNSVKNDPNLFKLLCLRLNYALYIGKESVATEIKIHRNQTGHLLFNENLKTTESGEVVYNGDLESAKLKNEELDEWAKKFYSKEETISQSKTGLPEHILYYINNMLLEYGYELNPDGEAVYNELNKLNRIFIEEGLVARVAFLTIISSIKETKRIS